MAHIFGVRELAHNPAEGDADKVVAAIEVEKYLNHRSKAKIDWG